MNQPLTTLEIKKQLISQGFEVYRTIGDKILLAERVRDNLIMDACVAVRVGEALSARASFRAELSKFYGDSEPEMFARAKRAARKCLDRGYREVDRTVIPIVDPSDRSRTLDTWYEVTVEHSVASFDELLVELRLLLAVPKVATPAR